MYFRLLSRRPQDHGRRQRDHGRRQRDHGRSQKCHGPRYYGPRLPFFSASAFEAGEEEMEAEEAEEAEEAQLAPGFGRLRVPRFFPRKKRHPLGPPGDASW